MSKISKFLIISFLLSVIVVNAQQADNSPYSRYGFGEPADNNFIHLRQMGGLGASFIDGYHINVVNPASYGFLNATAFDFGIFAKRTWLKDNVNTSKLWSGSLDYISLAFPLRNPINDLYDGVKKDYKLAMAFTLMPNTYVNYNIATIDSIQSKVFTRNYIGSGGSYKLLWGNSFKYKNFSLGANLGYLFGKVRYENKVLFQNVEYAYNDFYANEYNIRGFLWNAGILYTSILNKMEMEKNKTAAIKRISIGVHGNSSTDFSTTYNIEHQLIQQLPGALLNIDTIQITSGTKGNGKLPSEFGIGATYYSGEKFAIGVNFSGTQWADYENDATRDKKGALKNTSKISIGGYIRPDYKSFDNFFERIYYRYGIYYNSDPRVINDKQINTYGISFGLGMPFVFQRKISHINLGLNAGLRGQGTPISEKFVKFSLGVTFNDDEWFLKRKYN